MNGPLSHHPAVDLASSTAAVVVQEREVIGLDPFLLDALALGERAGVQVQLVTPPGSRLTAPLAVTLRETSGQWIVRRTDGRCTDGLTGRVLVWDGSSFAEPPTGPAVDQEWADPPPATAGSIAVDLTAVHPAAADLLLGETVEICCSALSDGPATGWGVAEPVSQRWSRDALTAHCRERAPRPTAVVLVGGSPERAALGTLTVTRTASGVHERVRLQVGCGPEVPWHRLDELAERLALATVPPRTALLGLEPGRADGTVEARSRGATVPYGLLLGPAVVAAVGRERALAAPAPQVRLVGAAAQPSLWARLLPPSGAATPGEVLARLLGHMGVT